MDRQRDRWRVQLQRPRHVSLAGKPFDTPDAQANYVRWNGRPKPRNLRRFFESYVNEQIVKEEPAAPRVSVIDTTTQATDSAPASEYVYTNRLI